MDEEELAQLRQLQLRDREVRAHEAAHAAVGGTLTGAPSYTYERGPDGARYAVAGEVSVSAPAASDDPAKTLQQAEQVQRAALAPADPSPQDRQVAAQAAQIAAQARAELARQPVEENAAGEQAGETEASGEAAEAASEPAGDNVQSEGVEAESRGTEPTPAAVEQGLAGYRAIQTPDAAAARQLDLLA
ncbi:hypothetical protein E4634_04425 [Mangrovimicrobium sediminis]|uniref:Catalase n=1 Tax=Mangrovimicrobium sediminis TaxID=2562682 RepID=A0A4Z0M7G7_9GAMM|nr:hypothetical protein E4634_04425 [Haliea sp. SAOS-164]